MGVGNMLQEKLDNWRHPYHRGKGKTEDIQRLIESETRLRQPRIVVFNVCKHSIIMCIVIITTV